MAHDNHPSVERLREQQIVQERVAREALAESQTDEEAQANLRRADKAHYLREKLEQQEQADREASQED